ncbi:hypothetical protein [Haloparvum sp. AD34]
MTENLLKTFRGHVANDRVADALETVDDLHAAFTEDRARTAADDTLATAVHFRTPAETDADDAATEFMEAATDGEQRRVELNDAIAGYIAEETPPEEVVSRVDATLGAYDTLKSKRSALADAADGVSTGVVLHLGPIEGMRVPKGGSVAVATDLANVGNDDAGSLSLSASADDVVSVTLSPTSLDALGSGSETAAGVDVAGEATGTTRVRVTVEGGGGESTAFRAEVLDKADYVSEALSNAERLLSDVEDRMDGKGGPLVGIRNQLEEMAKRLEQILDRIENGKGKDVNNRIESVINRFEALVNTLENDEETGLKPRVRSEYLWRCRDSRDVLESAKTAEA